MLVVLMFNVFQNLINDLLLLSIALVKEHSLIVVYNSSHNILWKLSRSSQNIRNSMPNKSVKGTRRPLAVLKFCFYQGSAASLSFRWRRAPYRNVRR